MRPLFQSPAPILILIVAIPVVAIAYAAAAGPNLMTYWWGFEIGALVCALVGAFVLVLAVQQHLTMRRKPVEFREMQRLTTMILLVAALVVAAYGLSYAIARPEIVVLSCAVVGAWFIACSIPSLRRTQVVTSFVVRRQADVVFAFMSDPRNLPQWRPEHLAVDMLTAEPIGPGSRFREHVRLPGGREVVGLEEYVDYEPNRRFTSHVPDAPTTNVTEITFQPVDDSTRVTDASTWSTRSRALRLAPGFRRLPRTDGSWRCVARARCDSSRSWSQLRCNSATDSMWYVCGNMSTIAARRTRYPPRTSAMRSRAWVDGSHET